MRRINKYAIWLGLLLIAAGFIYDVVFAGIPYQDAPIDLAVRYERNQNIANWTMTSGMILAVVAGLIRAVDRLGQR
jgi:hypothetical protein